jgi:protein transport protein SEC23
MSSLATKSPYVGDQEIGISGTSAWKICAVDPRCSYAFFFEVTVQVVFSLSLSLVLPFCGFV